jgi:hypothetical protein
MISDGRRFMLRVMAMQLARQAVKDDLKRRNCRPSYYASAEISKLAEQYLQAGHWAELEAEALQRIMASPSARAEYEKAGFKFEKAMARRRVA